MSIVFTICETFSPGESSVANRVSELVDRVDLAAPCTTRQPLNAEDDGFVFVSQDTFERMIVRDAFLECVQVLGNYYGTPRFCLQEARENGNDLLIRVDERGTAQVKLQLPDAVTILVLQPPSAQHRPSTVAIANEMPLNQRLREASGTIDPEEFDHVVSDESIEENAIGSLQSSDPNAHDGPKNAPRGRVTSDRELEAKILQCWVPDSADGGDSRIIKRHVHSLNSGTAAVHSSASANLVKLS